MAAIDLFEWGVQRDVNKNDVRLRRSVACAERRLLLVEDVPAEAELTVRELEKSGLLFSWRRVETEMELRRELREFRPTLILSDFTLPQFDGLQALQLSRTLAPQTPFIFVSGSIGEERAIDALQKGATDYVLKSNLSRLVSAVRRALRIETLADAPLQRALEHKMRRAMGLQQFEVHYQPTVCVHTRRIQGLEALLRWRDPEIGLVSTADFLPILESSGLIVEVGEWVLEQVAQDCHHWQCLGLPQLRTAVNISTLQLRQPHFAHRFLQLTRPRAGHALNLDIEITEDALLGDARAEIKTLKLLRTAGVHVALDDFGSGLSSLGKLFDLPVDSLKIDKMFVDGLPVNRSSWTMVSAILSLARGLRMTVTAEGVETYEQLETLRQLGCDQAQGYLHSPAVSRDAVTELLLHGKGWSMLPLEAPGCVKARSGQTPIRVNAI
jgi:EAL domain-containing protein (putative c-di-GMP-specific phosphodiesterase class I)/CheY-like chemotaxis protein